MKTVAETLKMLQGKKTRVGYYYLNPNRFRGSESGFIDPLYGLDIISIQCLDGFFFCEKTSFSVKLRNNQ